MSSLLAVQAVAEVVAASVAEAATAAVEVASAAGTVALEMVLVSLTSMFPFPSISPVSFCACPICPARCVCT